MLNILLGAAFDSVLQVIPYSTFTSVLDNNCPITQRSSHQHTAITCFLLLASFVGRKDSLEFATQ